MGDKQGFLMKEGARWKTWKKRYFVIKTGTLYYSKDQGSAPVGIIDLARAQTVKACDYRKKQFCFSIDTAQRTFYLCASSEEDRKAWIAAMCDERDRIQVRGKYAPAPPAAIAADTKTLPQSTSTSACVATEQHVQQMPLFIHMADLNIDLQRLVISYVPIRPRLLVLSYVCKRWRRLVLESLEKLPARCYLEGHPPSDFMPLVRLIGLCHNIRTVPQMINWPMVPNAPKLQQMMIHTVQLSQARIGLLRLSSCLTYLCIELSALSALRSRGITLDSFPHLSTVDLRGGLVFFADAATAADEWARLSLPSLTQLNWLSRSGDSELLLLRPHFSKLRALVFTAWEEPNGFLDFILSDAYSFGQLTRLEVTFTLTSCLLNLDTAQRLLRTCTSLKRLYLYREIMIEPAAHQLLAPYMTYFDAHCLSSLPFATPGLGSTLSLPDHNISDHYLPYLSRMQRLELLNSPSLDLSSAVGVTSLSITLSQQYMATPEDILTKWRIPTLRSLQLHCRRSPNCDPSFARTVFPILRVLFSDPPPAPFPFPHLTDLGVDISSALHDIDPDSSCGRYFVGFLALLPRIAARGIETLRVSGARVAEVKILLRERKKYLWMDINPGSGTVDA